MGCNYSSSFIFMVFNFINFEKEKPKFAHNIMVFLIISVTKVMKKSIYLSIYGHFPVELLCSLSDYYPWEKHEPAYLSSYRLNIITEVLQQRWLWHQIALEGCYVVKNKETESNFVICYGLFISLSLHIYIYIYIYIMFAFFLCMLIF